MRIRGLLLVLPLSMPALAAVDEPQVNARIALHVWQSAQTGEDRLPTYEDWYFLDGKRFKPIELREGGRVYGLHHRGDGHFQLFRKVETADGVTYQPMAGTRLQPGWKDVLIYLFAKDGGFDLRSVDITLATAKPGTLLIANFSGKPLRAWTAHGHSVRVLPEHSAPLSITNARDNSLRLTIGIEAGKEIRQVYSRSTAISPTGCYVGLLYRAPGEGGNYRFFLERGLTMLPEPNKSEP